MTPEVGKLYRWKGVGCFAGASRNGEPVVAEGLWPIPYDALVQVSAINARQVRLRFVSAPDRERTIAKSRWAEFLGPLPEGENMTRKDILAAVAALQRLNATEALAALMTELCATMTVTCDEGDYGGYRFGGTVEVGFYKGDAVLKAGLAFWQRDAGDLGDCEGKTLEAGPLAELFMGGALDLGKLRRLAAKSLADGKEVTED